MVIRAFTRSHAPLEYSAGLPTRHHARPSHHDLRNRRSRHLLRSRPPPMDRSSPDLSLYGGKTAIRGGTRLHVPMGTLALRSRAAAACKLNNGVFRAPIQKAAPSSEFSSADLSFGVGIAAIRVFTRLYAPSRLWRNILRASTRRHAAACVRHT